MTADTRKFAYTLTAEERNLTMIALGTLCAVARTGEVMSVALGLIQRLADERPLPTAPSGTDQAKAILAPPAESSADAHQYQLRDRWARDRNGNPITEMPKGAETFTVDVKAMVRKDSSGKERMIVTFTKPEGQGFFEASAWDPELFPFLATRVKQRSTLYIQTSKDGKYLNIVGVRA